AAWRAAEDGVAQIVRQHEESHSQAKLDRQHLVEVARSKHLRIQVIGPAAYQPGTANPCRLWVTDVDGRPVDAPVTARLVDADNTLLLQTKGLQGRGEWSLQLPANLPLSPESTPRFEVAAGAQEHSLAFRTHLR